MYHYKKYLLFVLFGFASSLFSFSQNTEQLIYLAFSDEPSLRKIEQIKKTFNDYEIFMSPAFGLSKEKLNYLEKEAQRQGHSGQSIERLRNTIAFKVYNIDKQVLNEYLHKLRILPGIVYVQHIVNRPRALPGDIAPPTNDLTSEQTYFGPDPGVDMGYAHALGIKGENVRVRDIEFGVNINHEDLVDQTISKVSGNIDDLGLNEETKKVFVQHGTAVIGVVCANDGSYGVSGMTPRIEEMVFYSEHTEEDGYNRVLAISNALNQSLAGDVVMYELQTFGAGGDYVPAEYEQPVWDLTKAATDAGIVIVAAAGNGNQDLDSEVYSDYMTMGDSGAIIVGAGTPNVIHEREFFSTYGSRVDVQAWGSNVLTTGDFYGTMVINNDINQAYDYFSGTSSATPIVASCAIALQSYYYANTGSYLTGPQIRDIFRNTGIPQGGDTSKNIGNFPQIPEAFEYLNETYLGIPSVIFENKIVCYPNPVKENLSVELKNTNYPVRLSLYNVEGKKVLSKNLLHSKTNIYMGHLPKGMYFAEFLSANKRVVNKIIK